MSQVYFTDHPCCSRHVATEFYRQPLSQAQAVAAMRRLFLDWSALTRSEAIEFWMDAGSLLGTVRDQSIIPWDDDIDIGLSPRQFKKLVDLKGTTGISDRNRDWEPVFETDNRVLRISPCWKRIRLEQDPCYWVDGKYVDKESGIYIDIVVYHDQAGRMVTRKYPIGQTLPVYKSEWLYPLQPAVYEGMRVYIPNDAHQVLKMEYGSGYMEPDHTWVDGTWQK